MCTVTWRQRPTGYVLFFNRDELNSRPPEHPPTVATSPEGVRYVAPRDGEEGGTWLLANENGLTVCLLNEPPERPWSSAVHPSRISRGQVVLATAGARSPAEAVSRVERLPLARIAPFQLLVLAPRNVPLQAAWRDGQFTLPSAPPAPPLLTSSSFAPVAVIAARHRHYRGAVARPDQPRATELAAFHRSHDSAAGAHSVLMRRPDAATRSLIAVEVRGRSLALTYEPAPWCRPAAFPPLRIRLPITPNRP